MYSADAENVTRKGLYGIEDFFYPFFLNNTISTFYWIKPPLKEYAQSTSSILKNLFFFTVNEFKEWTIDEHDSSGPVYGTNVNILDNIPDSISNDKIIIDMDLDYFINDDGNIWLDPLDFIKDLENKPWYKNIDSFNIATSIDGGYTPINKMARFELFINYLKSKSIIIDDNRESFFSDSWNNFLFEINHNYKNVLKNLDVYSCNKTSYSGQYESKIGMLYYWAKNLDKAEYYLESSLEIIPNHYYSLLDLSIIKIKKGIINNSIRLNLEKAVILCPEDPRPLSLLILVEKYLNNKIDIDKINLLKLHEIHPYKKMLENKLKI